MDDSGVYGGPTRSGDDLVIQAAVFFLAMAAYVIVAVALAWASAV